MCDLIVSTFLVSLKRYIQNADFDFHIEKLLKSLKLSTKIRRDPHSFII